MKRALWLVLGVLALGACKREAAELTERCPAMDAGTPVDPTLLAFLSRARAAHHLADDHENANDLGAAITPLAALVSGPLPHGATPELGPEVREVLADTRARLADLRSRQGAFDEALADVRSGLESATEPNYFRGHLLETEGLVEERRASALESKDPAAAAQAKTRAIELLEQAMSVQAHVIDGFPSGAPGSPALGEPSPAASGRKLP